MVTNYLKKLLPRLALSFFSCGDSDPLGPIPERLRSQLLVEAPDELAEAVQVDSVGWNWFFLDPFAPVGVKVGGSFRFNFTNSVDQDLSLRYELRFFDSDEFLVDIFFPFGQPLVLEPGQTRRLGDNFEINASDEFQAERLETMRIVLKVEAGE